MLAEKNEGIERAYELLKRFSQNELTRMGYESRQAELMDQMTREEEAKERGLQQGLQQGREQGIKEGVYTVARNLLKSGIEKEMVAQMANLTLEEVEVLV